MNGPLRRAIEFYRDRFSAEPEIVAWAPGRVEILGNHTDYNDGFVLSAALELGTAVAAGRSRESSADVEVWSAVAGETRRFPLADPEPAPGDWSGYPRGVVRVLRESGVAIGGLRAAVESDVPVGAGLSSSAALELSVAEAAFGLFGGRPADPMDVARLCQRAEVEYVGVPCGILDQFSSLFGRKHHALFLDSRHLDYERVRLGREDTRLVISDTGVKHALVDGQYRTLRSSCERAAARLAEILDRRVMKLRDVEWSEFAAVADRIDEADRRRAEHVLRENRRVLDGRDALRRGHVDELGRLMLASHASSRDLFGNSCPELDFLVEEARGLKGCFGGKLSGGGFGGATVHIVLADHAADFVRRLSAAFEAVFRSPLRTWTTAAGDGAFCRRVG